MGAVIICMPFSTICKCLSSNAVQASIAIMVLY